VSVLCPICQQIGHVLETRRDGPLIQRRRCCAECEKRWNTIESDHEEYKRLRNELTRLRTTLRNISAQASGAISELPHGGEGRMMPERLGGK
jgi:transcriptional regulator NrdR family protein